MTTAWMVRAGRDGERETDALTESFAIAGWPEMPDLREFNSRKELHAGVRGAYPLRSSTVVANWTGQLWRLVHVIEDGDYIVLPRKLQPNRVAIGRVTGGYQYRSDALPDRRHVRPVEWIVDDLPRSSIHKDLLYTLGSLLTICQLRRNGAADRIAALARTGTDPGPEPEERSSTELTTPDEFLERALEAESGITVTVRELLSQWGASRRTAAVVALIQNDLAEKGLTTVPPFADRWIDATTTVIKSGADADDTQTETQIPFDAISQSNTPDLDDPVGDQLVPEKPFTLRFGNLLRPNNDLISVRPDDPITLAQTRMLRYDHSQLAVISAESAFRGVINWETIAKGAMRGTAPTLVEHVSQVAPTAEYSEEVIPRIGEISRCGYIFVRAIDGKSVVGIVTTADLTDRFGEVARPFSLIEESERRLNRQVAAMIPAQDIAAATNNRHKDATTLTFGSYLHVLKNQKHFDLLGWQLDHAEVLRLIDEVKVIRNNMMHFSPDPIPSNEWTAIDGLLAMLRTVDPLH